jgi:NAD+ kinase
MLRDRADGTMLRRTEPGEELDVRLKMGRGQVVRLDSDRHQRHNQLKLSLLDLPFLPDEVRELAPPGSLPGSPCPRELEP